MVHDGTISVRDSGMVIPVMKDRLDYLVNVEEYRLI